MVKSPEHEARAARVHDYMHGFRKGVGSAYIPDNASADMKRGYEDGRKAMNTAHKAFCDELGHDYRLDVLR